MSLDENIVSVVQAIGAEIKEVRAEIAQGGGGGQVISKSVSLDLGQTGTKFKIFNIIDNDITAGKKIGSVLYTTKSQVISDNVKESIDDDEFDSLEFSIREVTVGSFKMLMKSNGIINNYKTIQYTII